MTKYSIAVEDKRYEIDVTRTEQKGRFSVKVNDEPREVELAQGKLEYGTPVQIKIDGKALTIQISKTGKEPFFTVKIRNFPVKAEVKTQQTRLSLQPAQIPTPTITSFKSPLNKTVTEGALRAPMAGKIVSVKVKKGDSVKAGTVVCILEAMKMENEITSPSSGTVQEITVSQGSTVSEGDALMIIK